MEVRELPLGRIAAAVAALVVVVAIVVGAIVWPLVRPALRDDLNAGLADLGGEIRTTNGVLGALQADFATTNANIAELVAAVGRLVERFDEVVVLLRGTEQHAENIDRKTGPPPPDVPPSRHR